MQIIPVADLTWVTFNRNNLCSVLYIFNFLFMGIVNNGSKIWHVCSVQYCVHGYNQQYMMCGMFTVQ